MPKYVIEREIPGAGKLSDQDIRAVSASSNQVLHDMTSEGKDVQWVESYVTGDKLFCVYNATDADTIREHAKRGGFPANAIHQVTRVIDPTTGEATA
jgi:hypothetical protein